MVLGAMRWLLWGLAVASLCGIVAALLFGLVGCGQTGSGVFSQTAPLPPAQPVTDANGNYDIPTSDPMQLHPVKIGDFRNGVSTLDASYVLQALTGQQHFTAEQMLACDVTGDGTFSTLDASLILQWLAGQRQRFPVAERCGSDWVFWPADGPVPAPGQCTPTVTVTPPAVVNWRGAVYGDCTGNWQ